MASRWMAPKLAKMAAARKFTPHDTKNRAGHTIEASHALSAAIAEVRKKYTGVVTLGEPGRKPLPVGKGKRQENTPFMLEHWGGRNDRRGVGDKSVTAKGALAVQPGDWDKFATQRGYLLRNGERVI